VKSLTDKLKQTLHTS